MKNINKNLIIFVIVLVVLVASLISVNAKSSDLKNNDDEKISFIDWLKNLFSRQEKTSITGQAIAEETLSEVDLSELKLPDDSNIQKVELEEGINFAEKNGLITFTGTGTIKTQIGSKNQIGKFYEYSLGEDGHLTINSLTGEVEEVKNLKLNKDINLGQSLDKYPSNIRGFPKDTLISYSKEKEFLEIKLPDEKLIKLEKGQNFDIFYANNEIQTLKFDATSETALEIFNGEYSFGEGGEVSMTKNVLSSSQVWIKKFPAPGKTNFETLVEGQSYKVPGIAIESEEIVFKEGTLINAGFGEYGEGIFRGFIAIDENGFLSVPASKNLEIKDTLDSHDLKINIPPGAQGENRPGISEPVYLFGNGEFAKESGKNNYVAERGKGVSSEEDCSHEFGCYGLLIHNGGGGVTGEHFEVSFGQESPIFTAFEEGVPTKIEEGARVSIIADTSKTGSAFLYAPQYTQKSSGESYVDESLVEVVGEGIAVGNDGNDLLWKNGKYIAIHDVEKPYSNSPGVDMHIITKASPEDAEMVGAVAVNDGKTIYFDETDKEPERFQAEYKKIGREAILKERPVLSSQSLVQGRVRKDTIKFLEDPKAEAIARDMTKNIGDIQSFQRQTLPEWKKRTGDVYYQGAISANDPNNPAGLDNYIATNGNPSFTSSEVNNYQQYEDAIADYQKNRDDLISRGIINANDASFPSYFGPAEENSINQIMINQNLVYDQAVVEYLRNNDLRIAGRALLRSPNFNTLSVWKANYGANDMRQEFQKIIK